MSKITVSVDSRKPVLSYSKDELVVEIRKMVSSCLDLAVPRFFSQLYDDFGKCAEKATNPDAELLFFQAQLDVEDLQAGFGQEIADRVLAKYDLYWAGGSSQNIKPENAWRGGVFGLETADENNIRCLIANLAQSRVHDAAGIVRPELLQVNELFCKLATRARQIEANPVAPSMLFAALERSLEMKAFKEDVVKVMIAAYDAQVVASFSAVHAEILGLAGPGQPMAEEAREDGGPASLQARQEGAISKWAGAALGRRAEEGAVDKQLSARNTKLIDIVGKVVLQKENIPAETRLKLIELLLPAIKGAMAGDDRGKFATIIKTIRKIAKEEIAEVSPAKWEPAPARERVRPGLDGFLGADLEDDLVLEELDGPSWWVRQAGGATAQSPR